MAAGYGLKDDGDRASPGRVGFGVEVMDDSDCVAPGAERDVIEEFEDGSGG